MSESEAERRQAVIAAYERTFGHPPEVLVRAPGRNTAIGDHLDYPPLPQDGSASSQTIAWATRESVLMAAGRRSDTRIAFHSLNERQSFTVVADELETLAAEAKRSGTDGEHARRPPWVRSTLALLYSAMRGVAGIRPPLPLHGGEFLFEGNIPQGAGQSSSAALLVAMALACNEVFEWAIPLSDAFMLADIARSGEHEEYSPFIARGRAGYLDQVASLTAREGKAVVIDHGDYARQEWVDLNRVEAHGYRNVVVMSGLSRALGETEYVKRVEELSRLPAALNAALARLRPDVLPRSHVYQFSLEEWLQARISLERKDAVLAQRARYVFEERERVTMFRSALAAGHMAELVDLVNASGDAMSMTGPYQISGYNRVPNGNTRLAALDRLREIVLRHAGPGSAARLIGGGGGGPLYALIPADMLARPGMVQGIVDDWRDLTGLRARLTTDAPGPGAEVRRLTGAATG